MNCTLYRKEYRPDGIFGELRDESGAVMAYTLEHAYPDGEKLSPKVAPGTYTCVRHDPNRLPYVTFMLENVPDFQGEKVTGILIHIGNFAHDSIGCILLGGEIAPNGPSGDQMLIHSRDTFQRFMKIQEGVASFQITITA